MLAAVPAVYHVALPVGSSSKGKLEIWNTWAQKTRSLCLRRSSRIAEMIETEGPIQLRRLPARAELSWVERLGLWDRRLTYLSHASKAVKSRGLFL